ncbi:MAG: type 4a pilus biogenesis protein PilO [Smithella sp.]|nr:type 4a pilus biogenesis protein PilO [Smithella sp.]
MAIDFNLNDIKKMSPKAKIAVVCLAFLLVGYLYWFYFLSSALEKKNSLSTKLTETQEKIDEKTKVAMQLDRYKADVAALQANYKIALQKLPDQREIPTLLHSVASTGKDAGVEFILFQPRPSVPKVLEKQTEGDKKPPPAAGKKGAAPPPPEPFYEEIPVAVSVIGSYQNILHFFNKVAKLPRIVNISDISIGDRKEAQGKGYIVTVSCTIKTYMFIDKKQRNQ